MIDFSLGFVLGYFVFGFFAGYIFRKVKDFVQRSCGQGDDNSTFNEEF